MALTPDQQAMLQLLLERGQSYADLAELLGGDEATVRTRARAALQELSGTDPDRHVGLTDYLLGQADPIGRADAVRHLKDDPDDLELARELSQKLVLLAPQAQLPKLPGEPAGTGSRRPSIPRPRISIPRPESGLSSRQGRLLAMLGGATLILVIVVLAIAGVFDGGGSSSTASAPTTSTSTPTAGLSGNATRVTLEPARKGSSAGGTMVFATTSQQPYFELQVTGLPQPPQGKAYVAWLLFNHKAGHPLTPVINSDGSFPANGTVHVGPTPLSDFQVPLAQRAKFVDISLSDAKTLNKELQKALQNTTPIVPYNGTSVLRGALPKNQGSG